MFLRQAVAKLNNESKDSGAFIVLDLCDAFTSVLNHTEIRGVQGSASHRHHSHRGLYGFRPTTLFVFGDSYADTGNNRKSEANSWKVPYGITFPGKPAGRFSDGRVLTDYLAKYLGLKSPIPYRWRKYAPNRLRYGINFAYGGTGVFKTLVMDPNMTTQIDFFQNLINESVYSKGDLQSSLALLSIAGNDYGAFLSKGGTAQIGWYGINFAYGGTGVFKTLVMDPNMTTQIDFFQNLINESVYSKGDLQSSLALLSIAGNDYGAFLSKGGTAQDFPAFIARVVNQIAMNLKRIHCMGVRKVAVTALQPLGCLPRSTVRNSFQQCNATENTAVDLHNMLLQQAVAKLNNESKLDPKAFVVLDLYGSFTQVLKTKGEYLGSAVKFETPLKPCCMGMSSKYYCGSVDEKGAKMYTVNCMRRHPLACLN
ncbi:hypothetical protein RHSIM_Rhsim03G0077900 [Rhododendron simsii]|uniref:GDSL esterase/lipase n=1 Tax=Rhododendron simsii TaxID=118357 RepID=A0A834LUE1_RHOSS|nr:hypothetical protein RHSIM_Rhsim03G0077900 [Rhododendron simsii]